MCPEKFKHDTRSIRHRSNEAALVSVQYSDRTGRHPECSGWTGLSALCRQESSKRYRRLFIRRADHLGRPVRLPDEQAAGGPMRRLTRSPERTGMVAGAQRHLQDAAREQNISASQRNPNASRMTTMGDVPRGHHGVNNKSPNPATH